MPFRPNYRHFLDVMQNRRPERLVLYEHAIDYGTMEQITGTTFAELINGNAADKLAFMQHVCHFYQEQTYDTVSYEFCISGILPGEIALLGGEGPIQGPEDLAKYPWDELPELFWREAGDHFDALARAMPPGMKAVGGPGNGVFELAEALVGLEYLPYMEVDYPETYAELFMKIGNMMSSIWKTFLERYGDVYVAGRFGDDLGFKNSLLTNPSTIRRHIIPQYRRLIGQVHGAGLPFLYHSCGYIFDVMEDIIAQGIDAKHSNEDAVAPYSRWIDTYGDRIGLAGGFDLDCLCMLRENDIYDRVLAEGKRFRELANGYALGSGNSIPGYVPVENYLAMIRAAQEIRAREPRACLQTS